MPCAPPDCLTGKSGKLLSSADRKNLSLYALVEAPLEARHPVPHKGAFRDRHERWHGMRWTLLVLLTNGANADGEVVWS
jgi:hypothetical protein